MAKETAQEQEFRAWGLSQIAVRNIVVFFIISLITAIGALSRVIVELANERKAVEAELIKSKDQAAIKIEQLKNENLETYLKLHELLQKQQRTDNEIKATQEVLKRVQNRLRK